MSESIKSNVQPQELNIASTPDEAVNAATTEITEQNSINMETPQAPSEDAANETEVAKPASRQEIISRLQAIADSDDALNSRAEVESLKVQFYRMRTAEIEAALKEHIAQGGEEALFVPQPDELEEAFKQHLGQIKAKRNAWLEAQEKEMQENLEKKQQLLEQLQTLVEKAAQGTPEVNEFRAVQAAWKEIKNIPQSQVAPLWKQYQLLGEQFYDVLKINSE